MRLFGRGAGAAPADVVAALDLGPGDRVLAWARDGATGAYVVASVHALHHVPGQAASGVGPAALGASGSARWSRPWLDVAAGAWEPKSRTITVTWADGGRPAMWTFVEDRVTLPAVLHDRVRASLVLAAPVQMGDRDLGTVALRKDLATGAIVEQVSLRRGSARQDPEVAAYVAELLRDLREQAGL